MLRKMSAYVPHMRPVCLIACFPIDLISVDWECGVCEPARTCHVLQPSALWQSPNYSSPSIAFHSCSGSMGVSFQLFPLLFCPIAAVSPPALPNSSASTKAWLCSFSYLIAHNKAACRKLCIFSGLQYFCSKFYLLFNYYYLLLLLFNYYFFLKRGFHFYIAFVCKPVILCEKCNLL